MGITTRPCRICGDAIRPIETVLTGTGHYAHLIDVPPHERIYHPRCRAHVARRDASTGTAHLTDTTRFTESVESNPRTTRLDALLTANERTR